MPNPELVEGIDRLGRQSWDGATYRHVTVGRAPLSGEGARIQGGRWNPPDRFPALYLGLTTDVVAAEFHRMARLNRRTVADFLPRELYRIDVSLRTVIDLRDRATAGQLGIDPWTLTGDDRTWTQAAGDAVHYLSIEGILAPSATGTGDVLVVFTDILGASSVMTPTHLGRWDDPSLDTLNRALEP